MGHAHAVCSRRCCLACVVQDESCSSTATVAAAAPSHYPLPSGHTPAAASRPNSWQFFQAGDCAQEKRRAAAADAVAAACAAQVCASFQVMLCMVGPQRPLSWCPPPLAAGFQEPQQEAAGEAGEAAQHTQRNTRGLGRQADTCRLAWWAHTCACVCVSIDGAHMYRSAWQLLHRLSLHPLLCAQALLLTGNAAFATVCSLRQLCCAVPC